MARTPDDARADAGDGAPDNENGYGSVLCHLCHRAFAPNDRAETIAVEKDDGTIVGWALAHEGCAIIELGKKDSEA